MTPFSLQIGYEGVLSGALNLPVVDAYRYGLESAPAVLQAETSHGFLKPRPIDLQSGRIEQVKARLSSTQDPDDAPARFTGCTADRSR